MSVKDISIKSVELYFLPVEMRVPLKFGSQVLTYVTCARAKVTVEGDNGIAHGWGETPLSVGWVWPSSLPYSDRENDLQQFCKNIAEDLDRTGKNGHAFEIGFDFIENNLERIQEEFNSNRTEESHLPHLAALVCFSLFDIAIHDAYGNYHGVKTYETYNAEYMNKDLSAYLVPENEDVSFQGLYPEHFFGSYAETMPVWHLVGGLDALDDSELNGDEPDDGYPVTLNNWIDTDGLKCLKIKLKGNDSAWDYDRLVKIGKISIEKGVEELTADFNCMVTDPAYVDEILDKLKEEHPAIWDLILYVEQPFPYDLEANQIDVHSTSSRKLLLMDESAHDWKFVKMGYKLGWTGVALKTCKTQTGALLSMCWAKAHGMKLMVQDLTNPMLAQIPHVLLAANAGTIMGVESNGMQFYPEASALDREVHPGIYRRREGVLDLSTLSGSGFGYRIDDVGRELPARVY